MARLFVDQLSVIDCSVLSAARGLIGASFIVDIELLGPLDAQGMVLDFSAVKKQLKSAIDASVDHRLLVPQRYAGLQIARQGTHIALQFRDRKGLLWQHSSPEQALALLPLEDVDMERLAPWLEQELQKTLAPDLVLKLRLREEAIDGAHYCYSHGLQQHDGACQRIAHGHRSRLEIFLDDARSEAWEAIWAHRFEDIYLATEAHCYGEALDGEERMLRLKYRAREGEYFLNLPKRRCVFLDSESTVENIARHLAEATLRESDARRVLVRAFEGVQKGALHQVERE